MPSCKRRRLKHEGQPQKAARSRSLHGVRPSGLVCPRHPPQLPGPQGQGTKHAAQKVSQDRLNPDSARPALVHRLPPQGCRPGLFRTTRRSAAPRSPLGPAWPDPSPAAPGSALPRTTHIAAPQPSGPAQPLTPACPSHLPSNPSRQHRARPPNLPTHPAASTQHPAPSASAHGAAAGASVSSSGVAVEGLHAHVQRWAGPGAHPPREVSWSWCCAPQRKEESKHH